MFVCSYRRCQVKNVLSKNNRNSEGEGGFTIMEFPKARED